MKRPEQSMELHDCIEHGIPLKWEIDIKNELKQKSSEDYDKIIYEWEKAIINKANKILE